MNKNQSALSIDFQKFCLLEGGNRQLSIIKQLAIIFFNFGFHCVLFYRYAQFSDRLFKKFKLFGMPFKLSSQFFNFFISFFYHVDITAAIIGPGLYIGHVGTIYIGKTTIGSNFSLSHNVTVGYGQSKEKTGIPVIGNNVWVGTGSVLSGEITIEDNTTVGPGSMLSKDLPSGSYACGNPARVIIREYDNNSLFGGFAYES